MIITVFILSLFSFPVRGERQSSLDIPSHGTINVNRMSWLHTDGRYIKNEANQVVSLRGAAVCELSDGILGVSKYWGQADGSFLDGPNIDTNGYLPNSFDWLKKCGVTCVRLAVDWYTWMGIPNQYNPRSPEQNETYKKAVSTFVEELANRGIYSYIDFHVYDMYESPDKWKNFVDTQLPLYWSFWQEIAERWKDQPAMMGVQLVNEPRDFFNDYPYHGYWWDLCLEAARKIHAVNPNLLILVASTDRTVNNTTLDAQMADAGYKVVSDQFVLNPLPEPNIVYVFHSHLNWKEEWAGGADMDFWRSFANGDNEMGMKLYENFLYRIAFRANAEYNLPIMNCEFNVKQYRIDTYEKVPYNCTLVLKDLLELMNKYSCHWMWWGWDGSSAGYPWDYSSDTNELVYFGTSGLSVWNRLSYSGEVFKASL